MTTYDDIFHRQNLSFFISAYHKLQMRTKEPSTKLMEDYPMIIIRPGFNCVRKFFGGPICVGQIDGEDVVPKPLSTTLSLLLPFSKMLWPWRLSALNTLPPHKCVVGARVTRVALLAISW